jgi:anti-anti-sigma factor
MEYREITKGNVQVFELAGKMMGDAPCLALVRRVDAVLIAGTRMVVMDVGGVQWMNSQAISHLIACLTKLRRAGGDLRLAGVAGKVDYYLRLTKLNTVIRTFAGQEEAVDSFAKEPPVASLPQSLAERRMEAAAL